MAKKQSSQKSDHEETSSGTPSSTVRSTDGSESAGLSTIPEEVAEDVRAFRKTDEGKRLVGQVLEELTKVRSARSPFEENWRRNLEMYRSGGAHSFPAGTLKPTNTPDAQRRASRRTINRLRMTARTEHSKFVSQEPSVMVVPASSEDSDFRAATAGEQVWQSLSTSGYLDTHYSEASWWKVLTGNGFIKTYWDGDALDPVSGENGMVRFGSVTPFHLYVPDTREVSLEEQPFIINGYTKTMAWAKSRFGVELEGVTAGEMKLSEKTSSSTAMNPNATVFPDSVTVLEVWAKPGALKGLPDGGLLHLVGSTLVGITKQIPYQHGMYPYAHLAHLHTGGFYRDSALDDIVDLQLDYNQVRSDISRSSRLMGRPQLLVAKGSIIGAKVTNETGLMIEYVPGMPAPVPMPMAEIPQYVLQQQDRILADMEDLSGQHEVSRGQAPGRGVTAGTAIAYLQESDDQFLTPQYRSDEQAFERIAKQALELFVENVSMPRKIRTLGSDRAFDTLQLSGADIRNGTDVKVEKGSSISASQVTRRAEIKEMFGMGLISAEQAVSMLELGGAERLKETIDVARSKAQRENIKMKNMSEADVLAHEDEAMMFGLDSVPPEQQMDIMRPQIKQAAEAGQQLGEEEVSEILQEAFRELTPPIIAPDDFDVHEIHIEVHNQFRMSQEYEQLEDKIREQFDKHVSGHEQLLQEKQQQALMDQLMGMAPPEGEPGGPQGAPQEQQGDQVPADLLPQ